MLFIAFVRWWYGDGWRQVGVGLKRRVHRTYLVFSMPTLLRTLFAPWRRIVTTGAQSLGDRFRAMVDNTVSRLVGFLVRLLALLAGCVALLIQCVAGGLLVIVWPALPPLAILLLVVGVTK